MDSISGREIDLPKDVRNMLIFDEKVLCGYRQAGVGRNVFGLESIFATDIRLIEYTPGTLRLRADVGDYQYRDMANIKLNIGILRSSINIVMRFNSESVKIENIPKSGTERLFKVIQGGIAGRLEARQPLNSPISGMSTEQINIADKIRQVGELRDSGHISEAEYQAKKKDLLNRM
jgi:hypothetical protein